MARRSVFGFESSVAAMAAVLLVAILGRAEGQAPSPDDVKIESFTYAGSGCLPGTADGVLSNGGRVLTVIFSNYTAFTDGALSDRRKNCLVTINLHYPAGYSYSVASVILRGYSKLDSGVTGIAKSSYHFSGLPGTPSVQRVINGPYDNNFEYLDNFGTYVSSLCNTVRNLNLNSEVRVNPGSSGGNGIITMDSKDLKLTTTYTLRWEEC